MKRRNAETRGCCFRDPSVAIPSFRLSSSSTTSVSLLSSLSSVRLMETIKRTEDKEESRETEVVELDDKRKLGIATLGSLKQHPRVSAFRRFIEGWYLSYFSPDAARSLPLAGPQKHMNVHGDNLGNVVQFMEREYPKKFRVILERIAAKIPGISKIDTERTPDGRLLLRFNDRGFQNPSSPNQFRKESRKFLPYFHLPTRIFFRVE